MVYVSAFFILLDRLARSVSLLQGPAKHDETNEEIRHGRASQALSFGFSRGQGEAAINPSQTLLLLVHQSRFENLRPRKSRKAVRSKAKRTLFKSICDCAHFYSRVQHRAHWRTEVSVYHALCFTEVVVKMLGSCSQSQ